MKRLQPILMLSGALILFFGFTGYTQNKAWKLEECINFALDKNIQVQKASLSSSQDKLYADQAKANRLPALQASVNQNFNWYKGFDSATGQTGTSKGSNSTSYGVNSNVVLFNGEKLSNKSKLAGLDLQGGSYYAESVKESVGLSILNAYLQVLYARESVSNASRQIESTTQQLALAKERLDLGAISIADYLQIKSELASEKSTLAAAESQLSIGKVSLMQLMELPVDPGFELSFPNLDSLLVNADSQDAATIYGLALSIKPQIKNAELNTKGSQLGVKIAQADFLPTLSMGAGLSSSYSSLNTGSDYATQLKDKINPSIALSLSIPIFQRKQARTNVGLAKIAVSNAELDEINTRNTLRKEIEQACADAQSARSAYNASLEQMQASQESYLVTDEKFKVGLLNSVDFLVQKTNQITAESKLLQSKFKLIFSYKVLDFYKGIPLVL